MVGGRQRKAPKSEIVFAVFTSREHWDKVRIDGRTYPIVPHDAVKSELERWETHPDHIRACLKLYGVYRHGPCSKYVLVTRRPKMVVVLANALHVRLLHAAGAGGVLLKILDARAAEEVIRDEQLVALTRAAWSRDIEAFHRRAQEVALKVGVALGPSEIAALGGFTRQALASKQRKAAPEKSTVKIKGSRKKSRRTQRRSEKKTTSQITLDLSFGHY